jgi:hypothetical protein
MIAAQLPGRTDNDIRLEHWNTRLKKKLLGKSKDHQTYRLAAAKQESNEVQSYATSEAISSSNIYGPQQAHHLNIDMDVPYSNFYPRIISQKLEQNCGSIITRSSLSSETTIFPLNPQQV